MTMVAAVAITAGCAADSANFALPDNVIDPEEGVAGNREDGEGLLSLADVAFVVNHDSEMIDTKSRASENSEASDDYLIMVKNETTNEEVYRSSYSEMKALTKPIILPVGSYAIHAASCDVVPPVSWDSPEFASSNHSFLIGADKTLS